MLRLMVCIAVSASQREQSWAQHLTQLYVLCNSTSTGCAMQMLGKCRGRSDASSPIKPPRTSSSLIISQLYIYINAGIIDVKFPCIAITATLTRRRARVMACAPCLRRERKMAALLIAR